MSIYVIPKVLEHKSDVADSLSKELQSIAQQIRNLYSHLDYVVKERNGLDSSIQSAKRRVEKLESQMYNVSRFLNGLAVAYVGAENRVVAESQRLGT